MSTVNSWNDLKKVLNRKISIALENEVFEEVRDVMQQHINSDVYDAYVPTQYIRRDIDGGFIADENIVKDDVANNTLVVSNTTPFNGSNGSEKTLAEVVESGQGYTWTRSAIYKSQQPRPFTQNTIEDLSQNKQHVTALKIGLERTGLQIK